MRAALDLLKGEEGVARDKVDAPKPKKDCLTSTNLTMIVMERARWMSSSGLETLTSANEFLNCCNRYQNEPLSADKNPLDWWKAKEYLTLAMLARKYLCVS